MAEEEDKGTPLKLFSGKEEPLNRLILQILRNSKQPLTKYETALEVRHVPDFTHTDKNTVYRRMDALHKQDLISIVGEKPTQPGWPTELYIINDRGIAALKLDKRNIERWVLTASQDEMREFNGIYPG